MKRILTLVMGVALLAALSGCASKPEQEITSAEQALDKARVAEADVYAKDEFEKAQQTLEAAKAEIAAQDDKFALTRSYDEAKKMLADAQQQADGLVAKAQANREAARVAAEEALKQAQQSLEAAQAALKTAPKGKDTKAELEAMQADLQAAQDSLITAQQNLEAGKYIEATNAANALKQKADNVTTEVQQAIAQKGRRAS